MRISLGDTCADMGVCLDTSSITSSTSPIVAGSSTETAALSNLPSMSVGYNAAVAALNTPAPPGIVASINDLATSPTSYGPIMLLLGGMALIMFAGGRR